MAGMTNDQTGGVFSASSNSAFKSQLNKIYGWYGGGGCYNGCCGCGRKLMSRFLGSADEQ